MRSFALVALILAGYVGGFVLIALIHDGCDGGTNSTWVVVPRPNHRENVTTVNAVKGVVERDGKVYVVVEGFGGTDEEWLTTASADEMRRRIEAARQSRRTKTTP